MDKKLHVVVVSLLWGVIALLFVGNNKVYGQLTVSSITAPSAVNDVLLGDGITASNIYYYGTAGQIGSFQCTNCNLGIPSGIVMSTGNANTAPGPNTNGGSSTTISYTPTPDSDLNMLYGGNKYDLCKLEFDFVPMGDSVVFEFVFGSDEYPNFVPSPSYNDLFGFFLSGPGISGPFSNNAANLALVPNTSQYVSIQTINNGSTGTNGPCVNCQYYVHNGNGSQPPYNSSNYYIQADGFTTVLQAKAAVECGSTYHIKMAIADNGDATQNSWVFLKEGSFQSALPVSFEQTALTSSINTIGEGCGLGTLILTRPCGISGDLTVDLTYGGTATSGEDFSELPSQVVIPADEETYEIPLEAFYDDLVEGNETIIVSAVMGSISGNITIAIIDTPPLQVATNDVSVACNQNAVLQLNVSGGSGNHAILWEGHGSNNPLTIENPESQIVNYTVTDVCIEEPVAGAVTISLVEYPALVVDLGNDINANCNTVVMLTPTVSGGNGAYTYQWSSGNENLGTSNTQEVEAQSGVVISLVVTDGCGTVAQDALQFIVEPQPIEVDMGPSEVTSTCLEGAYFVPTVTGGTGNYQYQWQVNSEPVGNFSAYTAQVSANSTVSVTVTDECGGYGYGEVSLLIPPMPINIATIPDIAVDCNESFSVELSTTGGVGTLAYSWMSGGVSLGTLPNMTTSSSSPMAISVTVNDQCGNISVEQFNVSINPSNLAVNVSPNITDVCPNEEVTLTANVTGGIGNISYTWSTSGNTSNQIVVSTPVTTTYSVSVTDGCNFSQSDSYTVQVWESLPFIVPETPIELCMLIHSGVLTSGGVPPYAYSYDINFLQRDGDTFWGNIPNDLVPVTVTDHCNNEATFYITISSCITTIPNVFTPNDDDANHNFVIAGIEGYPGSTLFVYNRWGNKIFESDNYRNEWSGAEQEDGTYYYILKRSDGAEFSGTVLLSR